MAHAIFVVLLIAFVPAFADTPPPPGDLRASIDTPSPELAKLDLPQGDLNAVYAARDYKAAWNGLSAENNTITPFVDSLEQFISYHGLTKEDYPIAALRGATAGKDPKDKDQKDKDQLDLLITASLLRLAHDLHGDTIDLDDDYAGWNFHRSKIDIPSLLATAIANNSANEFVSGLAPKNPDYAKLATALRKYRAYADKGGWTPIDAGPPLRPNDRNPRIVQLRARLVAEEYLEPTQATSDVFDEHLQKAVIAYQQRNGMDTDGHVGDKTLEALNTPVAARIEQIRANMERWRHMPDDYPPDRYARVNIADATILIFENGKQIYQGLVVVGKVDRKTPFIQSRVRSMIVNPSWHVPAKIARKDILPKLRKDPHYLEKLGFVISGYHGDPRGSDIDWASMPEQEFNFHLRQEPGAQNSLGHLKFDFDNDFAVYMHGTPHHELFAKAQRNYSSGCIRLQEPDKIGELLLQGTPGHWDIGKIQQEIDTGKTKWVAITNPMPLYVLYWTVFFDDATGAVNFRKDVYDYDRVLEPNYRAEEPAAE